MCALQCDVNGNLLVSATFSGSIGGNAAAGPTGAAVPASADFIGFNVGGLLTGVSAANPLPVSGTFTPAANASTNITQWNGVALGSPSAYGTSPGAVNVPGVNAFVTNSVAVTGTFFQATQPVSGTVTSDIVGHAGAVLDGTAGTPSAGVLTVQGVSGGTAIPVSFTPSGTQVVTGNKTNNNAAPGATNIGTLGAIANAAAPTWTEGDQVSLSEDLAGNLRVIQTSSPLPTGASTSALQPTNAAQGSTTSGQTGTLMEGAVTTSSPGYTATQTDPMSLTTAGALRVAAILVNTPADNIASSGIFPSVSSSSAAAYVNEGVYGGSFSGTANAALQGWSKMRTPTVFKTAQITSAAGTGNTAVWTPGSGNKFRLLKAFVQISDNASVAAGTVVSIQFIDSATNMPVVVDIFIPTTAVTTAVGTGLTTTIDLGAFGIQSATANNVLNVALTTALAGGSVRIITMGTEE